MNQVSSTEFQLLTTLISKSLSSPELMAFTSDFGVMPEFEDYYGFINLTELGISIVLNRGNMIDDLEFVPEAGKFYVVAIHLYDEGRDKFGGYAGPILGNEILGKAKPKIIEVLGKPIEEREKKFSNVLKGYFRAWISYQISKTLVLRIEIEDSGMSSMASITKRKS